MDWGRGDTGGKQETPHFLSSPSRKKEQLSCQSNKFAKIQGVMNSMSVCSPNSQSETQDPTGMVLGGGAFGTKSDHKDGTPHHHDGIGVPIRKGREFSLPHADDCLSVYKTRRVPSPELDHTGSLILDFSMRNQLKSAFVVEFIPSTVFC